MQICDRLLSVVSSLLKWSRLKEINSCSLTHNQSHVAGMRQPNCIMKRAQKQKLTCQGGRIERWKVFWLFHGAVEWNNFSSIEKLNFPYFKSHFWGKFSLTHVLTYHNWYRFSGIVPKKRWQRDLNYKNKPKRLQVR